MDAAAFRGGAAPVAWAVSAGRPLVDLAEGQDLSGIFAGPLRDLWGQFEAVPRFGYNWGFNITHFGHAEMLSAVEAVKNSSSREQWGGEAGRSEPFVVAQSIYEYLG